MDLPFYNRDFLYQVATFATAICLIFFGCLVILAPFIPALLLGAIFCLATWPAFIWLQRRLGNRPTVAAVLMTCLLALCFLVPVVFLGSSLAESFGGFVSAVLVTLQHSDGHAPEWVRSLPFAGNYLERLWLEHIADSAHLEQTLKEFARPVSQNLIALGASIGHGLVDLALGVIFAFFFFRHGIEATARLKILFHKIAGDKGLHFLKISERTVIGVVYGILGTALVLGALATLGFFIAGIPGAPFLGLLTFLLAIIPGGPPFVLVPATLWLFYDGQVAMGVFLACWSAGIIIILDFMVRPYLISLGSRMPLLLVLLGIMGGVIAFGFIGLFIGPALLAIAASLVSEWSYRDAAAATAATPSASA